MLLAPWTRSATVCHLGRYYQTSARQAQLAKPLSPITDVWSKMNDLLYSDAPTEEAAGQHSPEFGLFFDIDGVIVRGGRVLSHAADAFRLLMDENTGKFWVPTVFVTNAGNCLRQSKAKQLSGWLPLEVDPEQVIMSHSPLKMFKLFLDKHVLVSGQGPVREIATNLGFKKVITIDEMRQAFPTLDKVDHTRRFTAPCAFEKYFPRIEAVILFGEPVRWESNLQMILDVLVTNGRPHEAPAEIPYPHIPVLACNIDLMWMCEAPMPRFGHGCFLHCLESLYSKITGHDLRYTALVGKPSEITYHHSEHVLQEEARKLTLPPIKRMYCIGDNPDVDIYGANLFNNMLQKKMEAYHAHEKHRQELQSRGLTPNPSPPPVTTNHWNGDGYLPDDHVTQPRLEGNHIGLESCESILVCTGVYSASRDYVSQNSTREMLLHHNHRDFIMDQALRKPSVIVHNVYEAVQSIFEKEGLTSHLRNSEGLS
mgnify:CR=1 FL=1